MFADLAGFTALTEAHGDEAALDVLTRMGDRAAEIVDAHGGTLVKTIGDAIMVRIPEARRAIELGLHLERGPSQTPGLPRVRVGMHSGPALQRGEDWFGATVNLAARVAALATSGEVLLTEQTRVAAGALDGVALIACESARLKGIAEQVPVYQAVDLADERARPELLIDPVCRMTVDPGSSAGRLSYRGAAYEFCSLECAGAFAVTPERYVESA